MIDGRWILAFLFFEFPTSELISEINDLQLPRIDVQDSTDKDIFKLDGRILTSFEKSSLIFYIEL